MGRKKSDGKQALEALDSMPKFKATFTYGERKQSYEGTFKNEEQVQAYISTQYPGSTNVEVTKVS